MNPFKTENQPDQLHSEVCTFRSVFPVLQGQIAAEKWRLLFRKDEAPKLLQIIQYVLSISVSNAAVDRMFSVMGNICTNERDRLVVETVCSELCIFFESS